MQPKELLIVKAASLSRVAPQEWRDFLDALAVYNEVHRTNLLNSPLPDLPVNQGRARSLSELHVVLTKCRESADKIAGKANP